ncbi:scyllo-inositol 2-dehydrogenase (NADP+) [Marininema mesophilum]|uniref:Scyllo-inositol 2-dehydrogenase (NADP+) n=1 Tax=Marininema mesophilum TaxID=1048340 RepID=A0A1H2YDQ2_9BACL|nr:oxidoreductase [Marininema mesophilum]SDX03105.1 scyllo-inositol 2-dehydrogenase (NADP+) [Marininema mesophilum]
MNKIGVGIVGYGFSSTTFHIPLLQTIEDYEIRAIVSSQEEKVKGSFPHIEVVATMDELVQKGNIDIIIITSPNTTHFEYAKTAILHGKHVVLEKPFVVSVEEGDELIALAEQHDVMLSVYHNRRWDNDFRTIQKLLQEDKIGKIYTYETHYDRFRPQVRDRWREQKLPGSGILFDLGSHLIDQALQLFGIPEAVYADIINQRPGSQIDDYFHIILHYEEMRVILHSSSHVKYTGPHFSIHGEKGSIVKYGMDSQEEQLKAGMKPGSEGYGEDARHRYAILSTEEKEQHIPTEIGCYENYYKGVRDAIMKQDRPPVTGEEALNVIRIITACLQSSQQGTVVKLNQGN